MVGPASVNWRRNGLRLSAFILGARRRRLVHWNAAPATPAGAVSHSEVGNVWHFAEQSIASFNLGSDQGAPDDKQRVHDQPNQQPPHYPHVKPPVFVFTSPCSLSCLDLGRFCACASRNNQSFFRKTTGHLAAFRGAARLQYRRHAGVE
jgi:hypothetical protein